MIRRAGPSSYTQAGSIRLRGCEATHSFQALITPVLLPNPDGPPACIHTEYAASRWSVNTAARQILQAFPIFRSTECDTLGLGLQ